MVTSKTIREIGFLHSIWKKLQPSAFAVAVDTGNICIYWAGTLAGHFIKIAVAFAGIDADTIKFVSFMEKWFWIATFGVFFWRLLLRLLRNPKI